MSHRSNPESLSARFLNALTIIAAALAAFGIRLLSQGF